MKKLIKLSFSLVVGVILSSCDSSISNIEEDSKTDNYPIWGESVSLAQIISDDVNKTKSSFNSDIIVLHTLSIVNDTLIERVDGSIIAEIPIQIKGKEIIIENEILGEYNPVKLTISEDGKYITNQLNIKFNIVDSINPDNLKAHIDPGYYACVKLCEATHRALGISRKLDSICCFWYPKQYDIQ